MKLLAKFIKNYICIYLGILFIDLISQISSFVNTNVIKCDWTSAIIITIGYIIAESIISVQIKLIKKH